MSLVNDYLKRLGAGPVRGSARKEIPPSLRRLQHTKTRNTDKTKTYFRFVGIIVAIYTIGYVLLSVGSLLHRSPSNVNSGQQVTPGFVQYSFQSLPEDKKSALRKQREFVPESVKITNRENEHKQGSGGTETGSSGNMISGLKMERATVSDLRSQSEAVPRAVERVDVSTGKEKAEQSDRGFDQAQVNKQEIHEEPYPLTTELTTGTSERKKITKTLPRKKVIFTVSDDKPAYFFQIALQAHHNNNYKRAEHYYKRVLQKEPNHEDALVNLSAIYIREDRLGEARKLLKRALARNGKNSKALVNFGMIALQQKDIPDAARFFTKALQYNPIEETALVNLAYLAQKKHDYATAAQYYQKLLSATQENTATLLAFAGLQEKRKKYNSAIKLYRKSLVLLDRQRSPERYEEIRQRIQILRQYVSQQKIQKRYKK